MRGKAQNGQAAGGPGCCKLHVAPGGLPARGSCGRNTVAAVAAPLRAAAPFGKMAGAVVIPTNNRSQNSQQY